MSTASGLNEVLRRRTVGTNAEAAVNATMAAMAIRALRDRPRTRLGSKPERALTLILTMIDQMANYRAQDVLAQFVSDDHVALDKYEGVQAITRAAHQATSPESEPSFPAIDSMISARTSIQVDRKTHKPRVIDKKGAESLADTLDTLAAHLVAAANAEDRSRTSRYSVA